ncbi:Uncharacterised protein [Mycobacteroides abscessus subsp. massiliense]|nr:Uncharacterised protein [Mycobacteroides abscessus subsp. massiliense]SKV04155.1 Uncharacterised protein [Mycobacteroides abscessus subsp. massiliense]
MATQAENTTATMLCDTCGHVLTVAIHAHTEEMVRHDRDNAYQCVHLSVPDMQAAVTAHRERGCDATHFTQVKDGE